jgi:SAM-dependent methyltransferase
MPEIVNQCPLCHDGYHEEFDRIEFEGYQVIYQHCRSCGLIFQSPRMIASELDDFYIRSYREIYQSNEEPTLKDLQTQRLRAKNLLEFVHENIQILDHFLDIGCSGGMMLKAFQEHYRCQVSGVEPGKSYRNYAISQGLTVVPDLSDLQVDGMSRFDLISMAHVLEHLPDPVNYLKNLRLNHLTESGWLLLEVPNLYCHDSFEIAHLFSFSAHTLKEVLKAAGFSSAAIRFHGFPRSKLLPLYISAIAKQGSDREKDNSIIRESHVYKKRWFGMLRRRVIQKLFPDKAWLPISEGEIIQ